MKRISRKFCQFSWKCVIKKLVQIESAMVWHFIAFHPTERNGVHFVLDILFLKERKRVLKVSPFLKHQGIIFASTCLFSDRVQCLFKKNYFRIINVKPPSHKSTPGIRSNWSENVTKCPEGPRSSPSGHFFTFSDQFDHFQASYTP